MDVQEQIDILQGQIDRLTSLIDQLTCRVDHLKYQEIRDLKNDLWQLESNFNKVEREIDSIRRY